MRSSSIVNILSFAGLAALTQAAPVAQGNGEAKRGLIYSTCTLPSGLKWDGYCSQDPCGMWQRWCVDYEEGTWTPKGSSPAPVPNTPAPVPQPPATSGAYYQCAASGFDGTCSYDPCDGKADSWCSDYIFKTYTPVGSPVPAPVPAPAPIPAPAPETCSKVESRFEPNAGNTCKFGLGINFYTCQNSGFKGCCSSDPCAKAWCPDYKQGCYNA